MAQESQTMRFTSRVTRRMSILLSSCVAMCQILQARANPRRLCCPCRYWQRSVKWNKEHRWFENTLVASPDTKITPFPLIDESLSRLRVGAECQLHNPFSNATQSPCGDRIWSETWYSVRLSPAASFLRRDSLFVRSSGERRSATRRPRISSGIQPSAWVNPGLIERSVPLMETTIFRTGESSQARLYCRATAVSASLRS